MFNILDDALFLALRPFLPKIKKNIEKGSVENLLTKTIEKAYQDFEVNEDSTIEYMLTKEDIGWVLSFVELKKDNTVCVLEQIKFSDFIISFFQV